MEILASGDWLISIKGNRVIAICAQHRTSKEVMEGLLASAKKMIATVSKAVADSIMTENILRQAMRKAAL